ncbi:MAG: hypothetical protein ACFFCS_29095 [Candidatus Hodarchaeota archaeon]
MSSIFQKVGGYCGLLGCFQYVVLTAIAMSFYQGGTLDNPAAQGYTFWKNNFCDLGRTVSISGQENSVSMALYSTTMITLGVLLSIYFISRFRSYTIDYMAGIFSKLGAVFGLGNCAGAIFTAFVPSDLFPLLHSNATAIVTVPMMPMMLSHAISTWKGEDVHFSKKLILMTLLIVMMIATTSVLFFREDFADRESATVILAYNASQKIMVYSWLAFITTHAIHSKKGSHLVLELKDTKDDSFKTTDIKLSR